MNGRVRVPLLIAAAVVAADQATKSLMVAWLDGGSQELIGDFLQFRITRNPGASFSLFPSGGQVIAVVAIVIAVVVVAALPRVALPIERVSLALVMGGAVGNLVDRIFRGGGVLPQGQASEPRQRACGQEPHQAIYTHASATDHQFADGSV